MPDNKPVETKPTGIKVTVTQYKRDNDNEIIWDYNRDEHGKRLEGDLGKEKYLQTEQVSKTFAQESDAAMYVVTWTRTENSDAVVVSLNTGDVRGAFAIAWAQTHLDVTEQAKRAEENQTHYEIINGKRYLLVD